VSMYLEDIERIRQLKYRYFRGIDTADIELLRGVLAEDVHIDYHGVHTNFTTENIHQPHSTIEIRLVQGPFRHLQGTWRFTPLGDSACKIQLRLAYEFSSRLLEKLVGPVFGYIANNLVDAFVRRAGQLHGSR